MGGAALAVKGARGMEHGIVPGTEMPPSSEHHKSLVH